MSFNPQTHYQNKSVATHYDRERFASLAGQAFQRAELKSLEQIVQPLPSRGTLLDVPCGTGRIAEALLNWGFQVTAADISGEMIDVARQRITSAGGQLPALRASADRLPFPDSSFDAVISMRFLPHISHEPRRLMLREMARVSNRWVIFSNSYSNLWHQGRRAVKKYLKHQAPTRYPVNEGELQGDLVFAGLEESRRVWTFRFVSEEILVICEKTKLA